MVRKDFEALTDVRTFAIKQLHRAWAKEKPCVMV